MSPAGLLVGGMGAFVVVSDVGGGDCAISV